MPRNPFRKTLTPKTLAETKAKIKRKMQRERPIGDDTAPWSGPLRAGEDPDPGPARYSETVSTPRKKPKPRVYKAECYILGIDSFFLSTTGDWTEEVQYAKKSSKANVLDAIARDLKAVHKGRNIRLLRCKQTFTVSEIES